MNELQILADTAHYAKTGEIRETLVAYFDQHGRWRGDRQTWPRPIFGVATSRMRHARLEKSRRTKRTGTDRELLTSFVWLANRSVRIPYTKIHGSILIGANDRFSAPILRALGGNLYIGTRGDIDLPRLSRVGGDLHALHGIMHAPRLQSVGGKLHLRDFELRALGSVGKRFWADWTTRVHAPCLRHVGGDLIANMAECLDAPRLRFVGGDLEISDLTRHISVNDLEAVEGNFYAEGAKVLHAPSLKRIGGLLDTSKAPDFYNPKLSIGEYWFCHPDARLNWMARRVRYFLLRMPSMEI